MLALRAMKQGRAPDRRITQASRTQDEAYEYNHLMDMLCIASDALTQYLTIVHLYVEQGGRCRTGGQAVLHTA